jgi:hypothetical protein
MIPISADEIKEYWHDFCERQGVTEAARAVGDRKIEEDPEHWADQTMWDLLEAISGGRAR